MATDHAASVFTHSCLSTPRNPVTRLPADRLNLSNGLSGSQEAIKIGGRSHKPASSSLDTSRPHTTGRLKPSKWIGAERGRDESFQASLGPDTPYIRPATVNSGETRQTINTALFSSPENGRKMEQLDPSGVIGNERGQPPPTISHNDYAILFATLLESNVLLREEIQKLREDSHKTMTTVEQLRGQPPNNSPLVKNGQSVSKVAPGDTHVPHIHSRQNSDESALSLDSDDQGLPPKLLQNTWVESSTEQGSGENQQPSCMASSLSQQSVPASADDQHEYNLVDGGHEDLDSEEESSSISVEDDSHQIDSDSTCSSRLSSPSAIHEVGAHSSRSTESLLSSDSLTSSASSNNRTRARRANEEDLFASPGMMAVERMWSDFSVEDYAPRGSYSEEREKGGKPQKKEWTPKITVPKPFSMSVRESLSPKRKSRSMIQAEQERLEREAMEEVELKKQFRATPLPASTYLPLYELINVKNEQRREEVKMLSKQILEATERPFSFVKRDNERKLMREEDMRRSLELEKATLKEASFCAKPIPKHIFDPDVAERLKEQEEYREIRIRLRAQELLARSKLPGNMQLKGREYSIGALRKKRLEENQGKAFMTDEHVFHPTVSSSVPDYDRAYLEFQKQLALRKRTKHTTATEPFYLRTELIPSRKEQVLQDDEELQLENRWPFKAPKTKVSSKSPKHTRTKSSNVPYSSQLTKTAKVRFSLTQEKLTHALAREKALENQERERVERQDALKKTVTQKSQSCDPTAWLKERKQKKYQQFKQLDEERQRKYDHELEEIRQRVENRPLLLEQVPGTSARHSAQASALRKAGLAEKELNQNLEHT